MVGRRKGVEEFGIERERRCGGVGGKGFRSPRKVKGERWGSSELEQGRTDHGVRSWSREERIMESGVGAGKNG